MVFCIIAFIVFGIMGIFSAKYRNYSKEAFHCVFRMATLRPCNSDFDQRMKSKIVGKLIERHPKFARFIHKHFNSISWIFVGVFFISLVATIYYLYIWLIYGTCDPNSSWCWINILLGRPGCAS